MQRSRKVAVLDETGPDESFLVGTREQLEAFISQLQALLTAPGVPRTSYGISVEHRFSERLTESMVDTCLDGLVIVASEADRRRFINASRTNCGDLPVDWDGVEVKHQQSSS